MPVEITIADTLAHGRNSNELTLAVKEGLVIRDYLNAEISLGELAELLGMEYADARDWLHRKSIPTLKRFNDSDLEKIESSNFEKLRTRFYNQ